jgi:hypothetical protein
MIRFCSRSITRTRSRCSFSRCSYEGEPTELYGDGDTGKSLVAITAWHRLAERRGPAGWPEADGIGEKMTMRVRPDSLWLIVPPALWDTVRSEPDAGQRICSISSAPPANTSSSISY